MAEFNETFEAYNVTTVPKSGRDNRDTLPAAVAGGAAPDMAFQDRYIPKTMAVNGIVRDITDMVKASSIINTSIWERSSTTHLMRQPLRPGVVGRLRTLFHNNHALLEWAWIPKPARPWDDSPKAIQPDFQETAQY